MSASNAYADTYMGMSSQTEHLAQPSALHTLGFFKCVMKKRVISSGSAFRRESQPTISAPASNRHVLLCKKHHDVSRWGCMVEWMFQKITPHAVWGQLVWKRGSSLQGCSSLWVQKRHLIAVNVFKIVKHHIHEKRSNKGTNTMHSQFKHRMATKAPCLIPAQKNGLWPSVTSTQRQKCRAAARRKKCECNWLYVDVLLWCKLHARLEVPILALPYTYPMAIWCRRRRSAESGMYIFNLMSRRLELTSGMHWQQSNENMRLQSQKASIDAMNDSCRVRSNFDCRRCVALLEETAVGPLQLLTS
jgi:hypothetical protein